MAQHSCGDMAGRLVLAIFEELVFPWHTRPTSDQRNI